MKWERRAARLIKEIELAKAKEIKRAQKIVLSLTNTAKRLDLAPAISVFVEICHLAHQLTTPLFAEPEPDASVYAAWEVAWLKADTTLIDMAARILMHIEHEWQCWLQLDPSPDVEDPRDLWNWWHSFYFDDLEWASESVFYQDNMECRARYARTGKRLVRDWPALRPSALKLVANHNAKWPEDPADSDKLNARTARTRSIHRSIVRHRSKAR